MRILYHFTMSPFSRRARLALAHKGLEVELREARVNPAYMDEARRLWPTRMIPVLVEGDGKAIGDSTAITHYLDVAYPSATPLWPANGPARRRALELATLVDTAMTTLIDVGTRYYALNDSSHWRTVADEMVGRAQGALSALGERVTQFGGGVGPLTDAGWCAADIWLYTAVVWLEGLPARAASSQNIAQIVSLAWSLPTPLTRWADAHRERADVRALG